MAASSLSSLHSSNVYSVPSLPSLSIPSSSFHLSFHHSSSSSSSSLPLLSFAPPNFARCSNRKGLAVRCSAVEPLKVMISGAPASGKGTQCELIVKKFGLIHISTGDLLRAEVSAMTDIGIKAKEFMNAGRLVPDEIVTDMVMARLSCEDVKENGWLLDGYPRTSAQAESLEKLKIRPDIYILLDVPDEILIGRCVGRRLDPATGKIYHIKDFPPETEEIKARLVCRPDDTEDKGSQDRILWLSFREREITPVGFGFSAVDKKLQSKGKVTAENPFPWGFLAFVFLSLYLFLLIINPVRSRLETYKYNSEAILSTYSNIMKKIDGNRRKEVVFEEIDNFLSEVQRDKVKTSKSEKLISKGEPSSNLASNREDKWRGIPTRLNNIPHSREIRNYFYDDVLQATLKAVNDGKTRLKVEIAIPELNPEMDVYRIGTLMELIRVIALSFADDGKRVKVCVQGSMGQGALAGMPLQLSGTRKILEFMDWGDYGALGTFIQIGSIGAKEVAEQDDIFILVAPQNAVGNCIIDDLKGMTDAAGNRPVILINPRLKDLPGSSGIMQTMGRDKRLEYAATFENCYHFRLLYYAGTQYPIMGALRMSYPNGYELYKRIDEPSGGEKYKLLSTFNERPNSDDINDAMLGISRNKTKKGSGFWGFLSGVF